MSKAKNKLEVDITNHGQFYKAKLNGTPITRERLLEVIGIKEQSFRLEKHVSDFEKANKGYSVEVWPQDVD